MADRKAHRGYHLREADLYFEIIDPTSGAVLPDGECGEVVFTTLTRPGMPLTAIAPEMCEPFHA